MLLPSPQIAIDLLLISIGIVVTFDIKMIYLKVKSNRRKLDKLQNKYINIVKD